MHFQPGWEGGPGRPKGSCGGRAKALQILDAMLSKADIQEELGKALEVTFRKNPVRFFRQIIMPLLPNETRLRLDAEGIVQWQSLLTIGPTEPSSRSIQADASGSEPSAVAGDSERPCALPENCSTAVAEKLPATTAGLLQPTTSPSAGSKPSAR